MAEAHALAARARGRADDRPRVTKRQLDAEWNMTVDEALEAEARAQAHCMETNDFKRAYEAFATSESRSSRVTRPFVTRRRGPGAFRSKRIRFRGNDERCGQILPLPGPSSKRVIASLPTSCRHGASDNLAGRYAEDLDSECRALVRELGARGFPQALRRRRQPRPTCAASPSRAKRSPTKARSPTSRSRCKAWARARSACSGR